MALILLNPPVAEPISLAELKEFCRVDSSDTSQDGVITTLAMAARSWAEVYTGRRFVQQTWRLLLDFFPGYVDMKAAGQRVSSPFVSGANALLVGIRYAFALPYPPVQSIVSFQYQNANGQVTTMTLNTDYIADLQSNPARLTPPFGQVWPVARIVINAINVDYQVGYAMPVVVTTTASSAAVVSSGYTFQATDIGRPISIPGAGLNGGALNTVIAAITSPPTSAATLRDAAALAVTNGTGLLVNNPNGNPSHWEMAKAGIKMLVEHWYENRIPDENNIPQQVKSVLSPLRDLRIN